MESNGRNLLKLEDKINFEGKEELCSQNHPPVRYNREILQKSQTHIVEKLKEIIRNNVLGCDLTLCIFYAALKSYRVDCCLRPFPQYFTNANNEKDFISLKNTCDKMPPLKDFLNLPASHLSDDLLNLLCWLFIDSGFPVLKSYKLENLPVAIDNKNNALPQYVFKVNSQKSEEIWKEKIGGRDMFYAFHGSTIDNFYSILKFGLQQHFSRSKEVIFGNGIYLSNEMSVCTNYAPFGETWKHSMLGNKHSIIAVCQVINDEEEVKCKDEKNKKRAINANSYGEIPEKYFVVTNSELVKVRYLLVYRYKSSFIVGSFLKKNFLWIGIFFYFVMLILIGFFNGPHWRKFI